MAMYLFIHLLGWGICFEQFNTFISVQGYHLHIFCIFSMCSSLIVFWDKDRAKIPINMAQFNGYV